MTAQFGREIERRKCMFGYDACFQPLQTSFTFQEADKPITESRRFMRPIDAMPQVRHGSQHIQTLAARRCHRWIGSRWRVQVKRQVIRQTLTMKNSMNLLSIALWHENRMMAQTLIAAL